MANSKELEAPDELFRERPRVGRTGTLADSSSLIGELFAFTSLPFLGFLLCEEADRASDPSLTFFGTSSSNW